jgi:sigma-B regulation protein RsbU (phosphoserine phosphatase)
MLPRQNIIEPRVRTAWKYVPTDELAGDGIGLHLIDDRYLVAYVLDVSGHGVPAALLSVTAMHALEPIPEATSLLRDMTCGDGEGDGRCGTVRRPSQVAAALNRSFRAGENDGRYLTMVLCVLDTHTGRLRTTLAGHPLPLLLRGGDAAPLPDAGGFPIAIVDAAEYDEGDFQLRPGDRVCLVSDGVLEQTDPAGDEQFGATRLKEFLAARGDAPLEQVVAEATENLATWAGSHSFTDDVSLVIIEWPGPDS